jgi:Xaa-Pro aminopeptidase
MRPSEASSTEVESKLATVREALRQAGYAAARLRGVDWFAWSTCGGFGGILMTAETAVADVLITLDDAWILTNVIEKERLKQEVVPEQYAVLGFPWQCPWMREEFIAYRCQGRVCSDRPRCGESGLPPALLAARATLTPEEVERYRGLGIDVAAAMTEAVREATPDITEYEVAGHIAYHLRRRGIDSALIQVGGDERLRQYRHLLPTKRPIGRRAMMAICARRHGLYTSLTRFVFFGRPSRTECVAHESVARIESVALNASVPGTSMTRIYNHLAAAYADLGFTDQIHRHHQGGTTGYLAREALALPDSDETLSERVAVAWNPSLPGAKIEDTFLCTPDQLELLTIDDRWPTFECEGRIRPAVMVMA